MPSNKSLSPVRAGAPKPHKWQSFEVRTLICLIIKGEHLDSEDPMDIADKLNNALNPGSATTQTAESIYGADIPVVDVNAMLQRILRKKRHAVDLSRRHPSAIVTKSKVAAFMRGLDFTGSEDEWIAEERREKGGVERAMMRRRLLARKEGTMASRSELEDKNLRPNMLRSPRAQRLLVAWGIGGSFWEDPEKADRLSLQSRIMSPDKSAFAQTLAQPSDAAKDSHDAFAILESRRNLYSAATLSDVRTPTWMRPTPTPLMAEYGEGNRAGYSAPTLREPPPRQKPARESFDDSYGASTPQQPHPYVCGGYGGDNGALTPQKIPSAYGGFGGGFSAPTPKPPLCTYDYPGESVTGRAWRLSPEFSDISGQEGANGDKFRTRK